MEGKKAGLCLNWKVIGGLALVGLAVWAIAPQAVAPLLPLLLLAACPLSMYFMMRGMQGGGQSRTSDREAREGTHAGSAPSLALLAEMKEDQELLAHEIALLEGRSSAPGGTDGNPGSEVQPGIEGPPRENGSQRQGAGREG